MNEITSRKNPTLAHVRKLTTSAAYRRECREFVCDGRKLLDEALRSGAEITLALVEKGAELPLPAGVRAFTLSSELLQYVSRLDSAGDIVFCCRMPETELPDMLPSGRYLVLEGVQDPGNVGTVLRTAEAFSAAAVILVGACADPYNPKTVRSTMGAVFRQRFFETDAHTLKKLAAASGVPLYAAALRDDARLIGEFDLSNSAVVIGCEGSGVSGELLGLCDGTLIIPMTGMAESLNAAIAAAIVLYEGARQK